MVVGGVKLHVTVNHNDKNEVTEMFCKASEGHQAEVDGLCMTASRALYYGRLAGTGVDAAKDIAALWRFRRYEPAGIAGQPLSLSDALGIALQDEIARLSSGTSV